MHEASICRFRLENISRCDSSLDSEWPDVPSAGYCDGRCPNKCPRRTACGSLSDIAINYQLREMMESKLPSPSQSASSLLAGSGASQCANCGKRLAMHHKAPRTLFDDPVPWNARTQSKSKRLCSVWAATALCVTHVATRRTAARSSPSMRWCRLRSDLE